MLDLPTWQLQLARVGREDLPSGVTYQHPWVRPRVLKRHELWFVRKGQGVVTRNGIAIPIGPSNLFWFHPGITYEVAQEANHPLSLTHVTFNLIGANGVDVAEAPHQLPSLVEEVDPNLAESITRYAVDAHWESYIDYKLRRKIKESAVAQPYFTNESRDEQRTPFAPTTISLWSPADAEQHPALLCAHGLITTLLQEIIHRAEQEKVEVISGLDKFQRDTITTMAARMQESPDTIGSINDLAAEVGYSTDHFTRVFKKIMGYSPQQFLLTIRIAKSKQLLNASELSIKQIAHHLGYSNAYFFSRQFKLLTGCTPSAYRSRPQQESKNTQLRAVN